MKKINTRTALNPAYRKHKPLRKEVTNFISELQNCINAVKLSDTNNESEEHIKHHFIIKNSNSQYNFNSQTSQVFKPVRSIFYSKLITI